MAIDFSKFEKAFPADKMKKDLKTAKENGGDFEQLPDGNYTCRLEKMELGESQKGALMIKAVFEIIKGEFKKRKIFKNCVLTGTKNDGFMLHKSNEFLESLDSGDIITFDSWEQYNDLILDVAEAVQEDKLQYVVKLTKNGQYQDFEIVDILE